VKKTAVLSRIVLLEALVVGVPAMISQELTAKSIFLEAIESHRPPVVLFALEWCEFTWAVRKLFKRCGIAYRAIDLDGVAYQNDNWGGKIRASLTEHSGVPTIPQLFVGGELLKARGDGALGGGAHHGFDAARQRGKQRIDRVRLSRK